jgi:hypothetical protein
VLSEQAAAVYRGARAGISPRVAYDPAVDAVVRWLPFDPALPLLAAGPEELAARISAAGLEIGLDEPELIGYKPGERAVIRLDGHILKLYAHEKDYRAAVTGISASAAVPVFATPRFEGSLADQRLTVQSRLEGVTPRSGQKAGCRAGAFLRALQSVRFGSLHSAPAAQHLSAATRALALAEVVVPAACERARSLARQLTERAPEPAPLVPAHGHFDVGQLLESASLTAVVDFDEMCLAPAALDLATFAADSVRGRDLAADGTSLGAVLRELLSGYGAPPDDLRWHLAIAIARRSAHPFVKQVPDWPGRVGGLLAVAESVLEDRSLPCERW